MRILRLPVAGAGVYFRHLSCLFAAEQLLIWSASAFITKVLLVPLIMTLRCTEYSRNIPEKRYSVRQ